MAESHASLVLPAPQPPPVARGVARSPSVASDDSSRTLRAAPQTVQTDHTPDGDELKEVNVDDLTREINDLSELITTLSSDLSTLLTERDQTISAGPLAPPAQLALLSEHTTSLGSALVALPTSLATTAQRLARLDALAQGGHVAALPAELGALRESLATATQDATRLRERVHRGAWEEVDARESARRRLEERVTAENPQLGEEGVEMAVRTAFVGAQRRVAELDVLSYAGRVALENPATELAHLIDEAVDAHKVALEGNTSLSRAGSHFSAATTLVDPFVGEDEDGYDKLDHDLGDGDGERQPLKRMATSSTRHGGDQGDEEALVGGSGAAGGAGQKKLGRWAMLKLHWRDYLLRTGLLLSCVGLVMGVVVYQSVAQHRADEEALLSSTTAPPAATSH